jgi:hypothetical protein
MPLYAIDIKINATAYVKADSPEQAIDKAKPYFKNKDLDVGTRAESDVRICDLRFDDPKLPEISLSPAMTIKGYVAGSKAEEVV